MQYWDAVVANEDLLRLIITNAKRSFVITTYILCDNKGQGRSGHNVFQLVERCRRVNPYPQIDADRSLLGEPGIARAIEKVRLLRNNLDAHHVAGDDWKKAFGRFSNAEFDRLISTLYGVIVRCNKSVGLRRVSEGSLRKANIIYADRLLRALASQQKSGEIGQQFTSVDNWESQAGEPAE